MKGLRMYLFFSDIDGTLLRGDSGIPAGVKAAARRFADAGGILTLCTGRSWISTAWVAKEMDIRVPCVLFTGAVLYDFTKGEIVDGTPLGPSIMPRLERTLAEYPELSVMAYTADRIYLLRNTATLAAKGVREEIEPRISSLDEVRGDIYKIVMSSPDVSRLRECGEKVYGDPGLYFAFASRHFGEVVAAGADKGGAARRLAAKLGVPMTRTFAAGDAMTDYALFKACAFAFATADAPDDLMRACHAKIPLCEQGGMEHAFDRAVQLMREGWEGEKNNEKRGLFE